MAPLMTSTRLRPSQMGFPNAPSQQVMSPFAKLLWPLVLILDLLLVFHYYHCNIHMPGGSALCSVCADGFIQSTKIFNYAD